MARVIRADQVPSKSFTKIESTETFETDFALEQPFVEPASTLSTNSESNPADDTSDLSSNILAEAQLRAEAIITNAEQKASKLQSQAASLLESANSEAEQIIRQAQSNSTQLLADAQMEVEQQFQGAQQSGYQEGLNAGQETSIQNTDQLSDILQQVAKSLEDFKTQLVTQYEAEILEFVMVISTKIVGFELTINPNVIVEVVKEGLTHLKDKTEIFIHLNPDDLVLMKQYRPQLLEQIEGVGQLHLVADENLILGECRIENKSNLIDSTWREKLSNAAEVIWKLYHTTEVHEIEPS